MEDSYERLTHDERIRVSPMRARAIDKYDEAIREMACVRAVMADKMSVNEARRWLQLEDHERHESVLKPESRFFEEAEEWLEHDREERHA